MGLQVLREPQGPGKAGPSLLYKTKSKADLRLRQDDRVRREVPAAPQGRGLGLRVVTSALAIGQPTLGTEVQAGKQGTDFPLSLLPMGVVPTKQKALEESNMIFSG